MNSNSGRAAGQCFEKRLGVPSLGTRSKLKQNCSVPNIKLLELERKLPYAPCHDVCSCSRVEATRGLVAEKNLPGN